MNQDWDEIEALRASLREHMHEIKRLNEFLIWEQHRTEHVGTHGPNCAMWGPKHYECLLRAYRAQQERTRDPLTDEQIERLYDLLPSKYTLAMFARAVERAHGIGGEE